MQIRFATNTVALVGGVQTHFAAGVHDVTPDEDAQALLAAGDALLVDGDEGGGETPRPSDADLAAAEAAEDQRLADEVEAQRLADEEAAHAAAEAMAKKEAEEQAQAEAEAKAKEEAEAQAEAAAPAPAAKSKKGGGKK